jgi:hypothetical protein
MTQLRTLCCNLTLALLLLVLLPAASALAAGDDKTTITSTDTNVKVQLLLGGKDAKGRALPPVDVPPSSDGHTFKIEPQLFGSTTLPTGLFPYDCGDGKIVFTVPGANIDDLCPRDHRTPLAFIPLGGSGDLFTLPDGVTHKLTITSVGGAGPVFTPTSLAPSPNSLFWGQVGAGVGVGAGNSLNDCDPFNQVFLNSPCTATNRELTFNVGGQVGITPFFALSGEYFHIDTFDRKATAPTFLEQSSGETQFGSFMGRGIIPLGPVSLFGEGGVAVWRTNVTEHQTLASSTTPITTKLTVNGVSPAGGIGVDFRLSKHFGIEAEYVYFEQQKSVDSHYHVGVIGFRWKP